MVIKYENFAKNPEAVLGKIFKFLSLEYSATKKKSLNITGKHIIAGTPNKKNFVNAKVKLDTRWKKVISSDKNQVSYIFGFLCNFILCKYITLKKLQVLSHINNHIVT
jgi:hypothetical protein